MTESLLTRRALIKAGSVAALAGLAGCSTSEGASPENTTTDSEQSRDGASVSSEYSHVYEETINSVVLVKTNQGQGTGFVFDDSHIVTNAHVVSGTSSVEVRFNDGQWRSGDIVGTDRHSDLAAISVDDIPAAATPLPFIESEPVAGQEVVAIGNPYSLNGTVTTGIVSGVNRSIPAPTGFTIPDAIQTDAPVNPGNSGGPLVSLQGNVVAVINSGGGDNIAFGISAALTQRVVPELIQSGEYEHSYVGVSFDDVTPDVADANGLDEPRGLLVVETATGGPSAGVLQPSTDVQVVNGSRVPVGGDVMLSIDGTAIRTAEDLGSYLALETRPGDTVELRILRDGTEQTIDIELGTRPTR